MEDLSSSLNSLKFQYRKIFLEVAQRIQKNVEVLKLENFKGEIFDCYENGSDGRVWQEKVLEFLNNEIQKEIKNKLRKINNLRISCDCVGCGTCCRLACSEFSFEELKQKASNGDVFSKQFIETFIPYESDEEPKKIFPQYIEMLENITDGGYYFYHCQKVTKENRCPDYENRPQICRDFPDNPVAFLPPGCGYMEWKKGSENVFLEINALAEISSFYKNKIKGLMK